jgi:hypothetical protein
MCENDKNIEVQMPVRRKHYHSQETSVFHEADIDRGIETQTISEPWKLSIINRTTLRDETLDILETSGARKTIKNQGA